MILIADSGSTKTDWSLVQGATVTATAATQGINPFYQSDDDIARIVGGELLPQIGDANAKQVDKVCFYGAGVRPEMRERVKTVLSAALHVDEVEVEGDLLGAARALLGAKEGIACILGTGSNSGLYDGKEIVANTPPLGFILGDEGSGAVMGKLFVGALCKGLLPNGLKEEYMATTHQDVAAIIDAVYRKPLPNRYLAQTTRFIHQHLGIPEVEHLVVDNFRAFFRRNLVHYRRPDLPVCAIGSIAWHFRSQFAQAARTEGFVVGTVVQSPMEGLVRFHGREAT